MSHLSAAILAAIEQIRSLYLPIHRNPEHYTDEALEWIASEADQLRLTAEAELLRRRNAKEA